MRTVGIVCEYNPLHLGHARQLTHLRAKDPEAAVVCLMSGLYVQRGQPAVFSRQVRARAALLAGADLVLELPVTVSLRSAEGFAGGALWRFWTGWGVEGLSLGPKRQTRPSFWTQPGGCSPPIRSRPAPPPECGTLLPCRPQPGVGQPGRGPWGAGAAQ